MSGAFLAINGTRVVSAHVSVPYYGTWTADVMTPASPGFDITPGAKVTLTLGNLSLAGAVYRSGPFAGQLRLRIVGGSGGWQKQVTQQQYTLTGGVRLSTVLNDLAATVGERVSILNDTVIGSSFVREATQAGRILRQIAGPLWYVDPAGVTQVRLSRPVSTVSSAFLVNRWDGDRGEFEVSTEDYVSWMPGAIFSNELVTTPQTVSLAAIDTDNSGTLRFTILSVGPPTDRLIEDIRAIVRDEVENYTFTGVYEYAVQATDGTTVDAYPTSPVIPLPALRKVPLRTGIPGTVVKPAVGSRLSVEFLNGSPVGASVPGGFDSTKAQSVALQGGGPAAAREGDTVTVGYVVLKSTGDPAVSWQVGTPFTNVVYPGTAAGLVAATAAAAALVPPGSVFPLSGTISSGSSTVSIG
jgi:hypothetical protein